MRSLLVAVVRPPLCQRVFLVRLNIGNLRIFCKYRAKLRSGEMLNSNPAPGISYP